MFEFGLEMTLPGGSVSPVGTVGDNCFLFLPNAILPPRREFL
ncbi:hypothetical protein RE6C_02299 [Rhodopirellula europaea 6C]|uniref:Uncharacterized protein n=1 Tax=Rhodopirellula europaea 6C TaxID=1263867 RepID=M2A762_9BACT|nr:hypothetical protein RE6C_02299 [Rhodopirellula europaea 6C]